MRARGGPRALKFGYYLLVQIGLVRRKALDDFPSGWLLGSVGDRGSAATLLLMPQIEQHEVPLEPTWYGRDFALVGIIEPFGPEHYAPPDQDGVRWFEPPDYRNLGANP